MGGSGGGVSGVQGAVQKYKESREGRTGRRSCQKFSTETLLKGGKNKRGRGNDCQEPEEKRMLAQQGRKMGRGREGGKTPKGQRRGKGRLGVR